MRPHIRASPHSTRCPGSGRTHGPWRDPGCGAPGTGPPEQGCRSPRAGSHGPPDRAAGTAPGPPPPAGRSRHRGGSFHRGLGPADLRLPRGRATGQPYFSEKYRALPKWSKWVWVHSSPMGVRPFSSRAVSISPEGSGPRCPSEYSDGCRCGKRESADVPEGTRCCPKSAYIPQTFTSEQFYSNFL